MLCKERIHIEAIKNSLKKQADYFDNKAFRIKEALDGVRNNIWVRFNLKDFSWYLSLIIRKKVKIYGKKKMETTKPFVAAYDGDQGTWEVIYGFSGILKKDSYIEVLT